MSEEYSCEAIEPRINDTAIANYVFYVSGSAEQRRELVEMGMDAARVAQMQGHMGECSPCAERIKKMVDAWKDTRDLLSARDAINRLTRDADSSQ